jgi:hypothetical protein
MGYDPSASLRKFAYMDGGRGRFRAGSIGRVGVFFKDPIGFPQNEAESLFPPNRWKNKRLMVPSESGLAPRPEIVLDHTPTSAIKH